MTDRLVSVRVRMEQRRACGWVSQIAQNRGRISFQTRGSGPTDRRPLEVLHERFIIGVEDPFEVHPCVPGPGRKVRVSG